MTWLDSTKAVRVYLDGREVCQKNAAGKREYLLRTEAMTVRQKGQCAICTRIMGFPTFDHQDGRGYNGSHRDDRIEIDGEWHNAALCEADNTLKGSRRYRWIDGKYIPSVFARVEDWKREEAA